MSESKGVEVGTENKCATRVASSHALIRSLTLNSNPDLNP